MFWQQDVKDPFTTLRSYEYFSNKWAQWLDMTFQDPPLSNLFHGTHVVDTCIFTIYFHPS
jgi:hypothetical protein